MTDLASSVIFNGMSPKQLDFFLGPVVLSDPFRFLGGLCLPIPVDAYLLGFLGIMATSYFNSRTNRQAEGIQRWPLRVLVMWMVAIAVATTLNLWIWTTKALVIQFGSYHEIYDPNFYMAFYILGLFLITPAHLYWSFRIWRLFNRNYYILASLQAAAIGFATSLIILTYCVAQDTTVMATAARPLWKAAMNVSVWTHVFVNGVGTILTIWGMKRSGKMAGFKQAPWSTILLIAAESLALPTAFSLFVFLMYTISGRIDSAVPSMILSSKLYVICILHVLNHHANLADRARAEDFYGSNEENRRNSTIMDGRLNPAVLQIGGLSKQARNRHNAYNNDFDTVLADNPHRVTDSTNNLMERERHDPATSIRSSRSIQMSSEEDYK